MPPSNTCSSTSEFSLLKLPWDLQVKMLTFLRAYDLSSVQQVCRFYSNPALIDAIVRHTAERVYPAELTEGFEDQPIMSDTAGAETTSEANGKKKYYTFENLRNMELLVVARVLSRPEPASGGFVVSKSWCKTALQWLEAQQEQRQQRPRGRKLSKKKQRLRQRRLSDASPPWPNVNSDLLCEHLQLSRCSNRKSSRARRRIMDRQAWKVLNRLYPDSTQLCSTVGECRLCILQAETERQQQEERTLEEKQLRKRPLANASIRQFYTRTRGVPTHALQQEGGNHIHQGRESSQGQGHGHDSKYHLPSRCPLQDGRYYILPRAWCHGWRRYIKTGKVDNMAAANSGRQHHHRPPDAAVLLCHAHRLPLLPPHLEAFLSGSTSQLLVGTCNDGTNSESSSSADLSAAAPAAAPPFAVAATHPSAASRVPGQAPDADSLQALRAAGLSHEVSQQLAAMRVLEQQQQQQQQEQQQQQQHHRGHHHRQRPSHSNNSAATKNEVLDRENHSVVELLTQEEFTALEKCWPDNTVLFSLYFDVHDDGHTVTFAAPPCRECDATGRQCALSIKNRARGWVKKSAENARAPASLEY